MKARQAKNKVSNISSELGDMLNDPLQMQQEFLKFIKGFLGTNETALPSIDITIARYDLPTPNYQRQLVQEVRREGVLLALKDLSSDKALGVDDFPVEFFKSSWGIKGEEMMEAVLQFFEIGKVITG